MEEANWRRFGRLAVLIDAANLENSARQAGRKVHYHNLARFFREHADLRYLCFYTPAFETPAHNQFLRSLQRFGYGVISKPVKVIAASGHDAGIRKANFDVEIAVDSMAWLSEYDTLALFSGDSDFHYLIKHLQSSGKQVVVCSMRYHVARELVDSADLYLDVRSLGEGVLRRVVKP
ncbi:MAG: NYN domain-containing protein [Chloroflexi bacterium]|nr:NYN domain-containing protein [Chloroflexota bacterium]